ncbi:MULTISPECIES: hypothetical protein [Phenylobacterium]|jgi:hypothetical protein|uniref:Uncharacterized protein n=1 Tax=Phenylobacterium conjunctum TaxID=1298959 RepID=A0ABW3T4I5_9CAUL
MSRYIFYPRNAGGTALTFEVFELADRSAAAARCLELLEDHSSAVLVEVWDGETLVHTEARQDPALIPTEDGPDPAHA